MWSCFFFSFFFHPIYILALLSCSLPVVTQIRGPGSHSGPFSPLPTYGTCLHFIATRILHCSFLVHSLEWSCATCLFLFFVISSGGRGKIKLKLTTLHVACRLNSIAFSRLLACPSVPAISIARAVRLAAFFFFSLASRWCQFEYLITGESTNDVIHVRIIPGMILA